MRNNNYKDLFYDNDKLQSYIDNALIPMVQGLKDHPALGSWEVMNEPEGKRTNISWKTPSNIYFIHIGSTPMGQVDSDPCFDTTHLDWTKDSPEIKGPGWSGANVPFRNLLKFVNRIAAAIKNEDPKALVTTGSWSPWSQTNPGVFDEDSVHKSAFNHYQVLKQMCFKNGFQCMTITVE